MGRIICALAAGRYGRAGNAEESPRHRLGAGPLGLDFRADDVNRLRNMSLAEQQIVACILCSLGRGWRETKEMEGGEQRVVAGTGRGGKWLNTRRGEMSEAQMGDGI